MENVSLTTAAKESIAKILDMFLKDEIRDANVTDADEDNLYNPSVADFDAYAARVEDEDPSVKTHILRDLLVLKELIGYQAVK